MLNTAAPLLLLLLSLSLSLSLAAGKQGLHAKGQGLIDHNSVSCMTWSDLTAFSESGPAELSHLVKFLLNPAPSLHKKQQAPSRPHIDKFPKQVGVITAAAAAASFDDLIPAEAETEMLPFLGLSVAFIVVVHLLHTLLDIRQLAAIKLPHPPAALAGVRMRAGGGGGGRQGEMHAQVPQTQQPCCCCHALCRPFHQRAVHVQPRVCAGQVALCVPARAGVTARDRGPAVVWLPALAVVLSPAQDCATAAARQ